VASSRDRQRKLARAKMERQLARRAARARRQRQILGASAAAVVVLVALVGTIWLLGGFSSSPKKTAATDCLWTSDGSTTAKDVGRPPTTGIARAGQQTMTITTDHGVVAAGLDVAQASCTVASFRYLAGKHYFDGTKCHRLTTAGIYVLQCGDPTGSGSGGPGYRFPDENLPVAPPASAAASPTGSAGASPAASPTDAAAAGKYVYPRGTLAMANSGPGTNGSQFFIVYKDSPLAPNYTVFGQIVSGLDAVDVIAAAGVADGGQSTTDGAPKIPVTITRLTVTDGAPPPATPSPSGSPAPASAAPSPSASSTKP